MKHLGPDDPRTHTMKGTICARLGRHAEARESLRRSIQVDASLPAAHRELGNACTALGYYEEAVEAYQAALAIGPQDAESLRSLVFVYADSLDAPETARPVAKRLLDLRPDDPRGQEAYGWVLARQGDHQAALKYLQAAVQRLPTAATHYRLGWTLAQSGRSDTALEQYQAAASMLEDRQDDPLYATVVEAIERLENP